MARNANIQVRRDTAANWTSVNPVLNAGEQGFETNTGKFKIGDGSTAWTSLTYVTDGSKLTGTITPSDDTVTSAKIVDGTIVNADINASAAIAATKISGTAVTLTTLQNKLMQSNSILETMPRLNATSQSASGTPNGRVVFNYFTPEQTLTVSSLTIANSTGGTDSGGTTVRRLGLYTVSGTTHTLVARTASDATIGNTTNTVYTRSLDTTGGYPSTYTLNAGTTYAFALIFYNTGGTFTSPTLFVNGTGIGALPALSPVMSAFLAGQTDLVTSTSSVTNGNGYFIYARLT